MSRKHVRVYVTVEKELLDLIKRLEPDINLSYTLERALVEILREHGINYTLKDEEIPLKRLRRTIRRILRQNRLT